MKKEKTFCVYEHWRPDTGLCFYVGKGFSSRAYRLNRPSNLHHQRIVSKLLRQGQSVEIRLVEEKISESCALQLEKQRIVYWRSLGVCLVNLTDGGEGCSGWIPDKKSLSNMKKSWVDPLVRKKRILGLKKAWRKRRKARIREIRKVVSDPAVRFKISTTTREAMARSVVRKNHIRGISNYWNRKSSKCAA